jgi:hypothetical protein
VEFIASVRAARSSTAVKLTAVLVAAAMALALSGCSSGDDKAYDISPIFPLTENKCAQYNGDESGAGLAKTCMVTKSECERAAEDWHQSMRDGGVNDAIQFSCD